MRAPLKVLLALMAMLAFVPLLAFADDVVPPDPGILLKSAGSGTSVGSSFNFNVNSFGVVDNKFTNNSGSAWNELLFTITPDSGYFYTVSPAQYSCFFNTNPTSAGLYSGSCTKTTITTSLIVIDMQIGGAGILNGASFDLQTSYWPAAGQPAGEPLHSFTSFDVQAVPEPASLLLFGTGLGALAGIVRKRFA